MAQFIHYSILQYSRVRLYQVTSGQRSTGQNIWHSDVWLVKGGQYKERQGTVAFGLLKVDTTKTDKARWCFAS